MSPWPIDQRYESDPELKNYFNKANIRGLAENVALIS
jgi:hypothetical protein